MLQRAGKLKSESRNLSRRQRLRMTCNETAMRPQRGRHALLPHGTAHVREASLSTLYALRLCRQQRSRQQSPCSAMCCGLCSQARHRADRAFRSGSACIGRSGRLAPVGCIRQYNHGPRGGSSTRRCRHRRSQASPPPARPAAPKTGEHSSESQSRHVDRVPRTLVEDPSPHAHRAAVVGSCAVLASRSGWDGDWGEPATAPW
jgi:hypothetical protein